MNINNFFFQKFIAKHCQGTLDQFDFESQQIIFHSSDTGGLDFLQGYCSHRYIDGFGGGGAL